MCGKTFAIQIVTTVTIPGKFAFTGLCIVIYFYSKTNWIHQFLKFILFCSSTLHVAGGLSVHL
jgi:hypothetical protein